MLDEPPIVRVLEVGRNESYDEMEARGQVSDWDVTLRWRAWLPWPGERWTVEINTQHIRLDDDWMDDLDFDVRDLLDLAELRASIRRALPTPDSRRDEGRGHN